MIKLLSVGQTINSCAASSRPVGQRERESEQAREREPATSCSMYSTDGPDGVFISTSRNLSAYCLVVVVISNLHSVLLVSVVSE